MYRHRVIKKITYGRYNTVATCITIIYDLFLQTLVKINTWNSWKKKETGRMKLQLILHLEIHLVLW